MLKLSLPEIKNIKLKERLAFFTPKKYKESLKKQMIYAGIRDEIIDRFIGFSFFFTIFLGFVIGFDLWLIGWGLRGIVFGVGTGFLLLIVVQFAIILIADARAAEIEKVLPEIVIEDSTGEKAVAYMEIIPVLVEAMKEQQKIIENLESRIGKLEKNLGK